MTRLIDAEMLMEWVTNWLKMDHYYHQDEKRNDIPIMELKDIIDRLPTVDAIPIEWINKYANEHRAYIHAFAEMVICWNERKEE